LIYREATTILTKVAIQTKSKAIFRSK